MTIRARAWNGYFRALSAIGERLSPIGRGPVWHREALPWLRDLETETPAIRAEIERYLAAGRSMPDKEELDPGRTAQFGLDRWEILHLITYGETFNVARHFPATMAAMAMVPKVIGVMFSRLPPERDAIPEHCDAKNGTLRLHLGLKVPAGACYIRVEDEVVHWQEGRAAVIDASYRHSVRKDAAAERILLIVDFLRPVPGWVEQLGYRQYARQAGAFARERLRSSHARLLGNG